MAEHLVAWLYGTPVADLLPGREYRMTLRWRDEGIERWGRGSTVLSVGLELDSPTGPRDMRGLDFFENILPEGPALTQMAALAGTRPADTYGVLTAFGRDCAGAIVLLPDGEEPSSSLRPGRVRGTRPPARHAHPHRLRPRPVGADGGTMSDEPAFISFAEDLRGQLPLKGRHLVWRRGRFGGRGSGTAGGE